MGNAGVRQTGAKDLPDPRTYMQHDFPKFIYQEKIGNGKFMKSFLMRIDGTVVVVKVYLKPPDEELEPFAVNLTKLWNHISPADQPSLLPYQMWIKSDTKVPKTTLTPVYLVRQYFPSNLYDRLSTRPFLINMEKLWIIFQLMKALEKSHEQGVVHGDIKPENVLTTSWNWSVLTDFAQHKPVALPDDDTATFHYFFDSMARRRCYIAPERFYTSERKLKVAKASMSLDKVPGDEPEEKDNGSSFPSPKENTKREQNLTPAMDVFSLGCTVAEVFLDGECLIDLPSLLQYITMCREGTPGKPNINLSDDDSPAVSTLNRIKDPRIRKTVSLMTQFSPSDRLSVSAYRKLLEDKGVFPSFFGKILYDLFLKIHWHGTTPDDRINIICENYIAIMADIADCEDNQGTKFFSNSLKFLHKGAEASMSEHLLDRTVELNNQASSTTAQDMADFESTRRSSFLDDEASIPRELVSVIRFNGNNKPNGVYKKTKAQVLKEVTTASSDLGLDRPSVSSLIEDFEKLLSDDSIAEEESSAQSNQSCQDVKSAIQQYRDKVLVNEHTKLFDSEELSANRPQKNIVAGDGIFLVVQIICSSIRYLRHPETKVVSLMLLGRFGLLCQDTVKLTRIIPFVLRLIEDPICSVRAAAIRCLKTLVVSVSEIQPLESKIFESCIFPVLTKVVKDSEVLVRVTFAECLGKFAEASKRYLNIEEFARLKKANEADGSNASGQASVSDPLLPNQFDSRLGHLHDVVSKWIRDMILDAGMMGTENPSSSSVGSIVRRAILKDLVRLCSFFGSREKIMDMLLVHILSYVNHQNWDSDWELRRDFCLYIPCACAFLGPTVASEWVLPCIENARNDIEEIVVASSIQCICSLIKMNLLAKSVIMDSFKKSVPLLVHPCEAIRQGSIDMTVAIAESFGMTDAYVFVLPCIRPFLKSDLIGVDISHKNLKLALVLPISRKSFQTYLRGKVNAVDVLTARTEERSNKSKTKDDGVKTSAVVLEEVDNESESRSNSDSAPDNVQPEDSVLLSHLEGYIAAVAQNIIARKTQWMRTNEAKRRKSLLSDSKKTRPSKPFNSASSNLESSVKGISESHIDGHFLDMFLNSLSNPGEVHSVMVPSQKFCINNYTSEGARERALGDDPGVIDYNALKKMYGILRNPSEAPKQHRGENTDAANAANATSGVVSTQEDDADATDVYSMHKIIKALNIPPLSPDLGTLVQPTEGRKYSMYVEPLDVSASSYSGDGGGNQWRPKESTIVATMYEHTQAVNRLSVAHDQTFFVSASSDRTAKVWQVKGMERNAFPKSSLTYSKHNGRLLDATVVENSHSVATCSDDGAVHVWRVDMESSRPTPSNGQNTDGVSMGRPTNTTVTGSTMIKQLDSREGPIVGIQHFNTDVGSILTYLTLGGTVHSWDLRSSEEPFKYAVRPELGYPTSITSSPDRNWMCVGTSKGFVALWDIRFNVMCKLWKHSAGLPIHRLAAVRAYSSRSQSNRPDLLPSADGGYLFVASGENEAAVWGVPEGGECLKCFRSVPMEASSRLNPSPLPSFYDVSIPSGPLAPFQDSLVSASGNDWFNKYIDPAEKNARVRAIMGRISNTAASYLITAGADHHIRFWDFSTPSKCFTVSGLSAAQPKPVFESPQASRLKGKLFVCYSSTVPTPEATVQSQLPGREYRGITSPMGSCKDAVLDLKGIDLPTKMMLSSGRDGIIKLWR